MQTSGSGPLAAVLEKARRARSGGRLSEVRTVLSEAAGSFRADDDRYAEAIVLRELAEIERGVDPVSARRHYERAVALFRTLDVPLKLAHTVRHLGDVLAEAGQFGAARDCFVEALDVYRGRAETPTGDLANAVRAFAALNNETGDGDRARALWQEALQLYDSIDLHAGVAEAAARLALIGRDQGDEARVRRRLVQARTAAEASGDREIQQYVDEVAQRCEA